MRNENMCSYKDVCMNVQSIIQISQKTENNPNVHQQENGQIVAVHTQNIFSNK